MNIWNIFNGKNIIPSLEDFLFVHFVNCCIKILLKPRHTQIFKNGGMETQKIATVFLEMICLTLYDISLNNDHEIIYVLSRLRFKKYVLVLQIKST